MRSWKASGSVVTGSFFVRGRRPRTLDGRPICGKEPGCRVHHNEHNEPVVKNRGLQPPIPAPPGGKEDGMLSVDR